MLTLRYANYGAAAQYALKNLKYKYEGDSGFDLSACEDGIITYGEITVVNTDVCFSIPKYRLFLTEIGGVPLAEVGLEIQIRGRSGLARKEGLMVINAPGTIDRDYTGEVSIIMTRIIPGIFKYEAGDRIAQAVLCPVFLGEFVRLERIETIKADEGTRGIAGYGSTGVK